ncbi:MAG: transcription termination/antitermination protein NusG [Candidatus Omnitrophica bacterium]|nr:transcription termination/antitermination protein NusG [Candidatus Omnitrophota bacterium]
MGKNWYVVHIQTGQEDKVKASLEMRIKQESLTECVSQIVIPKETVSEVRGGKKKISERKFFPGYLFIEMELNEKTWYLLKTTPGILGFLGTGAQPVALGQTEIEEILKKSEERKEKPVPRVIFEIGESVRIKDGPFMDFNGSVEEVLTDKGKVRVSVSIFGRATPVELEFWQVEKI